MNYTRRRAAVCAVLSLLPLVFLPAQETVQATGPQHTIEDALSLARENAAELSIERLQILKSAAAVREAKARSGPSVSLQTSGSYLSNPNDGIKIAKGSFGYAPTPQSAAPVALPDQDYVLMEEGEHTYFRITTTLSQPIFTSGKLKSGIHAADLGLLAAEREYESKEREIERQVRGAYFGAAFAGTTERILTRAEETIMAIVADRQLSFDEGVITRADLLEAASRKASLSSQTAAAGQAEKSARAALSILTGGDYSATILGTDYRTQLPELDEEALVVRGLDKSPTRGALLHRVGQASALVDINKGSRLFLPDISLNVSLDVTGQRVPVLGANWTESWDANLIVTLGSALTVFDSGAAASKVEQAEHDLAIARQGLQALEQGFELQIRSSVEAVRSGWHEINRAEADLDLAREIERTALVSYENEMITRADMLGARLAALLAELDYERTRYVYETSLSDLEAAVGEELLQR